MMSQNVVRDTIPFCFSKQASWRKLQANKPLVINVNLAKHKE
jgi:hypothetical protein